ncbi:hypothetical protein BVRB_6g129300 [Beta vulgaris subsp. vulgaris]|nr:hypothetical protein BVRB_6g129300 [Beta vulgaris subsp. vulgaris]
MRKKLMGNNYKGEGGVGRGSSGPAAPSSIASEAAALVSIEVASVKKPIITNK